MEDSGFLRTLKDLGRRSGERSDALRINKDLVRFLRCCAELDGIGHRCRVDFGRAVQDELRLRTLILVHF